MSIESLIKNLNKKFGEGSVVSLKDTARADIGVLPSGSLALDVASGIGGYPMGRIIELFGQEGSGKTTLAILAMISAQKKGMGILFVDAEHAFNPDFARVLGLDLEYEKLIISQPEYGEQALDIVEEAVKSGEVGLVVVDSVAALVPKAELEGSMVDSTVGVQARMMGKALRRITSIVGKTGTIVIFINQVREKVGVMYGNPEVTPGGRALKFFSSMRIEVKRGETIKEGSAQIGHKIKIKFVKNKLAPPYKTAEIELIYSKGIDRMAELFDLAVQNKIIKRSGSWYSYDGVQLGQGKKEATNYLREHTEIAKEIFNKLLKTE